MRERAESLENLFDHCFRGSTIKQVQCFLFRELVNYRVSDNHKKVISVSDFLRETGADEMNTTKVLALTEVQQKTVSKHEEGKTAAGN